MALTEMPTLSAEVIAPSLCAVIERVINQALALNTGDTLVLSSLNQKTLTIVLAELSFPLSITITSQKVMVTTLTSASDCSIITSIPTLIALKNEQQLTQLIKSEQLDLEGDIKIAQQFSKVAESLHIDWQTELAKHIGDIATFKLVNTGQQLAGKLKFAKQQIESDMSEWLVHEKTLAITHDRIEHFGQSVEKVKQQVDALSIRMEAMAQKLTSMKLPLPTKVPSE